MTETEWLSSEDPQAMLAWLENTRVARGNKANRYDQAAGRYDGGPSDRKLRMFACACVWLGGTTSARLREATEDAEAYAEGGERRNRSYDMNAESAAKAATCAACSDWGSAYWLRPVTRTMKAAILRDIVGNPFRPVKLRRANASPDMVDQCLSLAHAAYDLRLDAGTLDPVRLSILADALTDVGCVDDIISHLRSPGPHYRGCWAVDLILGRE